VGRKIKNSGEALLPSRSGEIQELPFEWRRPGIKRSLEKAKGVVMFTGTTIENLLRSVERAELHALQQTWEEKEFEGNKYLVYRTNCPQICQQMMIEVA
jgi:hypothetical protein